LQKSSTVLLTKSSDGHELSIYKGELTQKELARNVARVKAAFPSLPPEFYQLLIDRLKEKGFSDDRLSDAVNNVIDHCQYPTPTLANFLSWDKRVKILTYQELCTMVTKGEASFDNYSKIMIGGKLHYVRCADKAYYRIPDEL
jgi:hypothetical protein